MKENLIEIIAISFLSSTEVYNENKLALLKKCLKSKKNTLHVKNTFITVNNIINTSQNNNLKKIAYDAGLFKDISNDLQSINWYKKAKAILLCYEFDLSEHIETIKPYRNNKNIFVRREAQIALVVFLGWKSLSIFPYVKQPISLWQQIRIIEKLKQYHPEPNEKYLQKALKSKNPSIKELLVRIIRSFELNNYKYYTIQQLYSTDRYLAESALDALAVFDLNAMEIEEISISLESISKPKIRLKVSDFISHQNLLLIQNNKSNE